MNFKLLAAATAIALGGCASRAPELSPSQAEELNRPLTCEGAEACGKLWRRAQIWVSENAGYKIQVATDAIIETYNAPTYSSTWAMKLVRLPREGAKEEFRISMSCGQVPLCGASAEKMIIRFKRAMLD